jgi:hypothetical protein
MVAGRLGMEWEEDEEDAGCGGEWQLKEYGEWQLPEQEGGSE